MAISVSLNVHNATFADLLELVETAHRMGVTPETYLEFDPNNDTLSVSNSGNDLAYVNSFDDFDDEDDHLDETDWDEDGDDSEQDLRDHYRRPTKDDLEEVFDRVTRTVNNNPMTQQLGDAAMRSLGDILSGRRRPPRSN